MGGTSVMPTKYAWLEEYPLGFLPSRVLRAVVTYLNNM